MFSLIYCSCVSVCVLCVYGFFGAFVFLFSNPNTAGSGYTFSSLSIFIKSSELYTLFLSFVHISLQKAFFPFSWLTFLCRSSNGTVVLFYFACFQFHHFQQIEEKPTTTYTHYCLCNPPSCIKYCCLLGRFCKNAINKILMLWCSSAFQLLFISWVLCCFL